MSQAISGHGVVTVVASAGTGKTTDLSKRIADAIEGGLSPDRLLATTFTKKAAAELQARIREELIERGRADLAAGLLAARLGTVNSVCGGLVSEFAFELGRSPALDVIPEDRQAAAFAEAAAPILARHADEISRLAARFGMGETDYKPQRGRKIPGWRDDIRRMAQMARINGLGSLDLVSCADRSVQTLRELFSEAENGETANSLDDALVAMVRTTSDRVEAQRTVLKKTTVKGDLPKLEEAMAAIARGDKPTWPQWAALTKLGATVADTPLFYDLKVAAAAHARHPRLKAELERFVRLQFACAAEALEAFDLFKAQRGYLDFVDQERLALEILRNEALFPLLQEKIGAIFVDEFQDSSPIQIAIFSALSRIAETSVWVGDPKQSIYGFRDADPELTGQAWRGAAAASGLAPAYLDTSRRLRRKLGEFVNDAFKPSFLMSGLSHREICFADHDRNEPAGLPPALAHWLLKGSNAPKRASALANGVDNLLRSRDAWPLPNRDGKTTRELRGADVAVLCRSSDNVEAVANALAANGIKTAVDRGGLMSALDVQLVLAALRFAVDRTDLLAATELVRFCKPQQEWLDAAFDELPREALLKHIPFVEILDQIRNQILALTPAETLDAVLHVPGLLDIVRMWGEPEDRFDRLEALRWRARAYEDEQRNARRPATVTGLCAWLAESDPKQPLSRDPEAVNVLTYHGAKGLEWPIVILAELESSAKNDPFGLFAEKAAEPDWSNPLAGRWLRYWPWPYGQQEKDVGLDVSGPASEIGCKVYQAEIAERIRLLYVGATRARDYLIFSLTGKPTNWLDELKDEGEKVALVLQPQNIIACDKAHSARGAEFAEAAQVTQPATHPPIYGPRWPEAVTPRLPLSIRPSAVNVDGAVNIVANLTLGTRIPLTGTTDVQLLGEACHRFLAADSTLLSVEKRVNLAERILRRWDVSNLSPERLVEISDRFHRFVSEHFPNGIIRREWPVTAPADDQLIEGRIDCLIESEDQLIIVDHKAFPGIIDPAADRLKAFAGQASLYAIALRKAHGPREIQFWLHQPIAARMLRVEISGDFDLRGAPLAAG